MKGIDGIVGKIDREEKQRAKALRAEKLIHFSKNKTARYRENKRKQGTLSPGRFQLGFSTPNALGDVLRGSIIKAAEFDLEHSPVKRYPSRVGQSAGPAQPDRSTRERFACFMKSPVNRLAPHTAIKQWVTLTRASSRLTPELKAECITAAREWVETNKHLFKPANGKHPAH